jgi:hypothetical protein
MEEIIFLCHTLLYFLPFNTLFSYDAARRRAAGPKDETALLENREFSYRELKHITNNFSLEIGKGGFGAVFLGYLENGNPVAVKIRSQSSSQGCKEFLAEVNGN